MLQYLINTTIIWLACLLLYEWLLRKESFHQYNRAYLLVSLAAGLLLPAVKLDAVVPRNETLFGQPTAKVYQLAERVQQIKEPVAIQEAAAVTATKKASISSGYDAATILWGIYLLGVMVSVGIILREAVQLSRLYAHGNKSSEAGCRIVQTGKQHPPFSFFSTVFVSRKEQYSSEEWRLLMAHESAHGRQLHTVDNILIIVLRILFWFHPLPHIYYKRLLIVHEFQADRVAAQDVHHYGTFLLEQNLLQRTPILTHSLHYSPIKNRIAMLTKTKSARARLVKYAAIVPLSFVIILLGTQTTLSSINKRDTTTVRFKGSEVEMHIHKVLPFRYERELAALKQQNEFLQYSLLPDSIPYKNDWNGGTISFTKVPLDTIPVAIDGKPIYGKETQQAYLPADMIENASGNYLRPVYNGPMDNLERYLFSKLHWELNKLEDGIYSLRLGKIVIDDKGSIAYYEHKGIDAITSNGIKPEVANGLKSSINKKVVETLSEPIKFAPATSLKDGKAVNVRLDNDFQLIEVKGHLAKLVSFKGC